MERADAPSAKQIAVIWIDEDGLAPQIQGYLFPIITASFKKDKN